MVEQTMAPWYSAPWWNSVAAIGTLISACVAAWAARAAMRSAKAAEDSTEISRSAAVATTHSTRAYVTIAGTQGSDKLIPGIAVGTVFLFRNVGSTPALRVSFAAGFYLDEKVPTEELLDSKLTNFTPLGPITPDVPIPIACNGNTDNEQFAPKAETVVNLKAGKAQAVVFLKLLYEDVFGTAHVTRVAFHYDRFADGFRFAPYYNSMK